jgi:folylpolyglutamate synthase/dihydropteroate synthase
VEQAAVAPARAALAVQSVGAALEAALDPAAEPGPVIVAGSLYLVGEARAILVDDPRLVPDPPLPLLPPPLASPEAQP